MPDPSFSSQGGSACLPTERGWENETERSVGIQTHLVWRLAPSDSPAILCDLTGTGHLPSYLWLPLGCTCYTLMQVLVWFVSQSSNLFGVSVSGLEGDRLDYGKKKCWVWTSVNFLIWEMGKCLAHRGSWELNNVSRFVRCSALDPCRWEVISCRRLSIFPLNFMVLITLFPPPFFFFARILKNVFCFVNILEVMSML